MNHPLTTPLPQPPNHPPVPSDSSLARVGADGRKRDPVTGRFVQKLDDEILERVKRSLRAGVPLGDAAASAGIWRSTLHDWLRRGRRDDAPDELKRFVEECDAVMADWTQAAVARLYQIGNDGSGKDLQFLLERLRPEQFGRRERVDLGNADGKAFQMLHGHVDLTKLSDDELATLRSLTEKAQPDGADIIDLPVRRHG